MRSAAIVLLLLTATICTAQGSAAGVGGGSGGAGGFGGSMGGRGGGTAGFGDATTQGHPEDDPGQDGKLYDTRIAILTPGDRVEYKIKVEKGATLFAGATSEAFDPALDVEDASGKVLLKNDDREEGDQSPFVAVRFAQAGTYTLKVQSYKQASGGKFTLKMRTFVASEAALGRTVHDFSDAVPAGQWRFDVRIRAKKGAVYDLRSVYVAGPGGGVPNLARLVGPSGVENADFARVSAQGGPVFEAKVDGDYYAEYQSYAPVRFATDIREVPVLAATVDGETTVELSPDDLALVEFPVAQRRIVRTRLLGDASYFLTAPTAPNARDYSPDPAFGYDPGWTWFSLDRDGIDHDVVRVYRASGTARLAVRSTGAKPQCVTIRNSTALPEWKPGESLKGTLDVGEVRLYRLTSAESELMRVAVASTNFKPRLDIFRFDGALANTLPNRTKHTAADDLYFPKADEFLVRLSCDGYGGSGEFTLRRDVPVPDSYSLGRTQTLNLDGTSFGLYAVDLQAGVRYQLTTDEATVASLRADLLDEDGAFLRSQAIRFDKVTVQYFVPTRSGRHRLWLRGPAGVRRFRLEPNVAPSLAGP